MRRDIFIKKIIALHWESLLPVQLAAYLTFSPSSTTAVYLIEPNCPIATLFLLETTRGYLVESTATADLSLFLTFCHLKIVEYLTKARCFALSIRILTNMTHLTTSKKTLFRTEFSVKINCYSEQETLLASNYPEIQLTPSHGQNRW